MRVILAALFAVGAVNVSVGGKIAWKKQPPREKFVHVVLVWLKKDLSAQQIQSFESDMRALGKIKSVKAMHIGKPAGTPRQVVDNSYTYMMVFYFRNVQGHDAYQQDPIHKAFVETHKNKWTRLQIYDALLE